MDLAQIVALVVVAAGWIACSTLLSRSLRRQPLTTPSAADRYPATPR